MNGPDILADVDWVPVDNAGADNQGELYATHTGIFKMSGFEFRCYQLNDGRRVLDSDDLERFFGVKE